MDKNNQIINLNYPVTDTTYEKLSEVLSDFSSCNEYTNTSYIDGELRTFYNNLGDSTKRDITDITSSIESLGNTINDYVSTCKNIDETKYNELQDLIDELYSSSNLINDYSDLTINHKYDDEINDIKKTIINKLGINEESKEAKKLRKDIDKFIMNYKKDKTPDESKRYETNLGILKFFISKIPDNYEEYAKTCKWDSVPNKRIEYENYDTYCEWFDVNGAKIRVSSHVNTNNSYPSLQLMFNRVYCYNLINEMKSWDKKYINLLKKREYIDAVVADAACDAGAACYYSGEPYSDFILLPTEMAGTVYESDYIYNYLSECLVHEMSHYADAIVGLTQLKEYDYEHISKADNDFYSHVESLMDDKMYEIQLINKHGKLTNEEKDRFINLKNQPDKSFCENLAELLRADLVDHDKFVQVIGKDEYDNLFNRLNEMNRRSEFGYKYTPVIKGDNKEVLIYREKDGVKELEDEPTTGIYNSSGKPIGQKNSEYILKNIYDTSGELVKEQINEYYSNKSLKRYSEQYPDGRKYQYAFRNDGSIDSSVLTRSNGDVNILKYDENGALMGEQNNDYYDNGVIRIQDEKYKDGREYHYEYREDGTLNNSKVVYPDGSFTLISYDDNNKVTKEQTNSFYENGNVKTHNEIYPDGREYHYNYRSNGTLENAYIVYSDGSSSSINYDNYGNEIPS